CVVPISRGSLLPSPPAESSWAGMWVITALILRAGIVRTQACWPDDEKPMLCGAFALPQLAASDFAGRRLGERGSKFDFARILVGRDRVLHMFLNFGGKGIAGREFLTQNDERLDHQPPHRIGALDGGRLQHGRMAHQSAFHFEWRNPVTAGFHHVVVPPLEPE